MKNSRQVKHLSALAVALFICSVSLSRAQSSAQMKLAPDNPELKTLFVEDQHDRGSEPFVEFDEHGKPRAAQKKWPVQPDDVMEKHDRARTVRVRELLQSDAVHSGQDYWFAAIIFHHGEKPEDYLLAHVLALAAAYKGNRNGRWLAAASLDRYLLSVSQKQIYGTQFTGKPGEAVQADYDTQVLDDTLRANSWVISVEAQHKQWLGFQSGQSGDSNTTLLSCLMGTD